jgi:hypothetical protein
MNESRCSECNKIIYKIPCPYCGSVESHLEVSVFEKMVVRNSVDAEIVRGSSEVTIEKGDQVVTKRFNEGVSSGTIIDDSLSVFSLQDVPQYVRDQITYNINRIEQYTKENPPDKVTHEHSFELNLKIFKYKYKRTFDKPKK